MRNIHGALGTGSRDGILEGFRLFRGQRSIRLEHTVRDTLLTFGAGGQMAVPSCSQQWAAVAGYDWSLELPLGCSSSQSEPGVSLA